MHRNMRNMSVVSLICLDFEKCANVPVSNVGESVLDYLNS